MVRHRRAGSEVTLKDVNRSRSSFRKVVLIWIKQSEPLMLSRFTVFATVAEAVMSFIEHLALLVTIVSAIVLAYMRYAWWTGRHLGVKSRRTIVNSPRHSGV